MRHEVKKISGFILVAVAIGMSCNKDILNVPPPTQSENSFFTSEEQFRRAIIGTYAKLTDYYSSTGQQGFGNAQLAIWFLPGDDLTQNGSDVYEFFKGLNPSDPKINQFFRSSYSLIGRANKVLEKLAEADDSVFVTPDMKKYNEGEMLFLRAFAHFMLWNVFGTAPIDTVVVRSTDQLNLPGSKQVELLDQAINDLQNAAALLPKAPWDNLNTGRVTANSAYGLLGKCLVFRASATGDVEDYAAAVEAFNKISGAGLMENFKDNFEISSENNIESLFEFQAGENITGDQNTWLGNDDCDCGVAGAYYQMFYEGDASYMSGGPYFTTKKLRDIFEESDPRVPYTLVPSMERIDKYIVNGDVGSNNTSYNNHRILRYADILLLKAEAVLLSGGNKSDAVELINSVRARARNMVANGNVPADRNINENGRDVIMQWIMDERLRELAAEGHRWFDLRRWHMAGHITLNDSFFSSEVPARMGFTSHYLYFPIPDSETSKNPNVIQNPGY
jgi:tetratricopeptide (TPR) repeat protein